MVGTEDRVVFFGNTDYVLKKGKNIPNMPNGLLKRLIGVGLVSPEETENVFGEAVSAGREEQTLLGYGERKGTKAGQKTVVTMDDLTGRETAVVEEGVE